MRWLAALAAVVMLAGCASYRDGDVALSAKADFSPAAYLGRWYEIASYPTPFQRGCTKTRTVYSATDMPGRIGVANRCERDGKQVGIDGYADVTGPGQLRVALNGVPVAAPYWVLWTDRDYQTAVVGVPSGRAGWVLSRSRTLSPEQLQKARAVLQANGYDLSELRMTPQ